MRRLLPGLVAVALAGCGDAPRTVERLAVAEAPGAQRLEAAGIGRDELTVTAARLLAAAPGFVAPAQAGRRARRYRAELQIHRADVLGSAGGVAHVILTLELRPQGAGGEPAEEARRETGRAAEPVGAGAGALRAALERATRSALERAVSSFALAYAAEAKPTAALVKNLGSPEARVREHAVRALGARRAPEALDPLVGRLKDPDPEVAERAVGALALLRDPRAVPPLIEMTHRRQGPYVANLARIVGDIGGEDARAWLLTLSSGHPDEVVRGAARVALSELAAREPQASAAAARK
jgi:hypothetical protein